MAYKIAYNGTTTPSTRHIHRNVHNRTWTQDNALSNIMFDMIQYAFFLRVFLDRAYDGEPDVCVCVRVCVCVFTASVLDIMFFIAQ